MTSESQPEYKVRGWRAGKQQNFITHPVDEDLPVAKTDKKGRILNGEEIGRQAPRPERSPIAVAGHHHREIKLHPKEKGLLERARDRIWVLIYGP